MMSPTDLLILIELLVLAVEGIVIFLLLRHLRGMDSHSTTLEEHIAELERHQLQAEEHIGRLCNCVGMPDGDVSPREDEK